jgi:hypothetical protein
MEYRWNALKDAKLRSERDIGFDDVVKSLSQGGLLATMPHPNLDKYPLQHIYVVEINGYAYLVPYVQEPESIFLKTIIPSRKATGLYLKRSTP